MLVAQSPRPLRDPRPQLTADWTGDDRESVKITVSSCVTAPPRCLRFQQRHRRVAYSTLRHPAAGPCASEADLQQTGGRRSSATDLGSHRVSPEIRSRRPGRSAESLHADRPAGGESRGHELSALSAFSADRCDESGAQVRADDPGRYRRSGRDVSATNDPAVGSPVPVPNGLQPISAGETTIWRFSGSGGYLETFPIPSWPTMRRIGSASHSSARPNTSRPFASSTPFFAATRATTSWPARCSRRVMPTWSWARASRESCSCSM